MKSRKTANRSTRLGPQFSPAPWTIDNYTALPPMIYDARSVAVCSIHRKDQADPKANAALILAAPMMIAALLAYEHAWAAEKHAEEAIIPPDAPATELQALFEDADKLLVKAKTMAGNVVAYVKKGKP